MTAAFWRLVETIARRVLEYAERQLPQEPDVAQRLERVIAKHQRSRSL
jgi:hypothetical protein